MLLKNATHLIEKCNWNNETVHIIYIEASRGTGAQSVTLKSTGCGCHSHSRRWNIYLNLYFHFFSLVSEQTAALCSATRHAMPPEVDGKWETKYLNTRLHAVPFVYPAVCGIQREKKAIRVKYIFIILLFSDNKLLQPSKTIRESPKVNQLNCIM